jgi:hypothetical protein
MNKQGIIAITLIACLVTFAVVARMEISPAQYEKLAKTAATDPPLIAQIRDAMKTGKINKMSYYIIMSEHNGTRKQTNAAVGRMFGAKDDKEPINIQEARVIIRALLIKSTQQ